MVEVTVRLIVWPTSAGALAVLVTVALPLTLTVAPLCVTIESVTLALPPFVEKRGKNFALQAVPEAQTI